MRVIARAAVLAVPLLLASGLSLAPALADTGPCLWAGTSYANGALVNSGGEVFECSTSGTNGPVWEPRGLSGTEGTPVTNTYDGTQNLADFSSGAVLQDSHGEAFTPGSAEWQDIGSWSSFAGSTGCADPACDGHSHNPPPACPPNHRPNLDGGCNPSPIIIDVDGSGFHLTRSPATPTGTATPTATRPALSAATPTPASTPTTCSSPPPARPARRPP